MKIIYCADCGNEVARIKRNVGNLIKSGTTMRCKSCENKLSFMLMSLSNKKSSSCDNDMFKDNDIMSALQGLFKNK